MATEWTDTTLGEICELRAGSVFPPALQGKSAGKYPFAKVSDMNLAANGAHLQDANNWVDDEDLPQLKAKPFPAGTTVFAKIGEALKANRLRFLVRPTIIDNNMMGAVPVADTVDPRFFFYALSQFDFGEVAGGTALPYLTVGALSQLEISLPPIAEQRAITHILGTLDDKIELNRRMNETLEAMARALFKSWFVDFDPVRAKAERRDPGLPKEIADRFPDSFEDSELGKIPRGWQTAALGDHFDAVKGISYKGSGLGDSGMPLHNLNSVLEGGGYKYEGIKYYSGEYADRHLVKPGDVIVANTEQGHDRLLIGYAAIVPRLFGERGLASHHIYRMRPKPGSVLTPTFLCHLLNSPQMHDIVSGYGNGTTVNMLPISGVQQPQVVVPPLALVTAFDRLAMTIELRREEMVVESSMLAALRDTLLPMLITGELRMSRFEASTNRAT
jgi:type I restriction enzyme S subunit